MSDESFLRAIREDLDDDAPRLVYADVLQERGDPRGELIVVQCAKARLERAGQAYSAEHLALLAREEQLLKAHESQWLMPYGLGFLDHRFERGLVASVNIAASDFRTRWPRLQELPLRELELIDGAAFGDLALLATAPSSLRTVTLRHGSHRAHFDAAALFAILRHGDPSDTTPAWNQLLPDAELLPALRGVFLYNPRPPHLEALAEAPSLRMLDGNMCQSLTEDAIRAFDFARIEKVSFGTVPSAVAKALFEAKAPALRDLFVSRVGGSAFDAEVTAAFAKATFLEQLVALRTYMALDEEVARVVDARMPSATSLGFDAPAAPGGIEALIASSVPPRLRELVLTGGTTAALVEARFERLERLTLQQFVVRVSDVRALPPIPRLDAYHCDYERIADGKHAIRERWPRATTK